MVLRLNYGQDLEAKIWLTFIEAEDFETAFWSICIDLNLVSTAIQRLHLSEFDFYFKVASTFMSTDTFSSTEPQQAKYKRRKLQKDIKHMGPEHASREKNIIHGNFFDFRALKCI